MQFQACSCANIFAYMHLFKLESELYKVLSFLLNMHTTTYIFVVLSDSYIYAPIELTK